MRAQILHFGCLVEGSFCVESIFGVETVFWYTRIDIMQVHATSHWRQPYVATRPGYFIELGRSCMLSERVLQHAIATRVKPWHACLAPRRSSALAWFSPCVLQQRHGISTGLASSESSSALIMTRFSPCVMAPAVDGAQQCGEGCKTVILSSYK